MVDHETPTERTESNEHDIRRRDILKATATTAATAAVGVGMVGTASATEVQGKPVFCGCSQVCVCVTGRADVLMARETDDGEFEVGFVVEDGELNPYPTGEPRYSGNFCVSTDDEDVPDGKIIGLQTAGTRWVNSGQCAQKALEAEGEQLDSTHLRPEGDSGGPCGVPPCEHPGRKDERGGRNGSDN